MSTAAKHDPDAGYEPAFAAPKERLRRRISTCSAARSRYPYDASDLRYKPPYEPLEAYMKLARRLGFERFVFVQPSAYGLDNSCMLDAMAEMAPATAPRHRPSRRDQAQRCGSWPSWHALGVRGVRINVSPVRKPEAGFADHAAAQDRAHGRDLPRSSAGTSTS